MIDLGTWTDERITQLTLLWDEGVTTAEIGRRIGVTKNAVIGKVHRLGLVPRVITQKPAPRRKVAVTVVPSVAAVAASLDEVEVDDVDAADTPPAETRPASAPRRRPVGRRTPTRGA